MNIISTSIRLDFSTSVADDALLHERLLRPQQAAKRVAYQRLVAGLDEKALWRLLRDIFPHLTGRNLNDAILSAAAVIKSQQERLPDQLHDLTRRIGRSAELLQREQARKAGARPERVRNIQRGIANLTKRRDELQAHLDAGTVPAAVFGSRKRWDAVQRGLPEALVAWRDKRTGEFLTVGARNQKGNSHCRLRQGADGQLQLTIRVPNGLVERQGKQTTLARWLTFPLNYSRQYESLLRSAAQDGDQRKGAYTVRLLRQAATDYRAYVTVAEPVAHREYAEKEPLPEECIHLAGIDLNLGHIALALTDGQGQFRGWQAFTFPNLGELPRDKSEWQIGNLARDAIQWAKDHDVQALVLENLNIERKAGSAVFNRRTVPFSYRQLAKALARTALRQGLVVKRINPAYTSWIGRLKYARPYGLSMHVAAAYVIGRRGLGLQERLPTRLIHQFPELIALLQSEIAELERKAKGSKKGENHRKMLAKRREWRRRLENWKEHSPESGRPWLLWATLKAMSNTSAARAVLFGETTDGRKDPACRSHNADHIRLAVAA